MCSAQIIHSLIDAWASVKCCIYVAVFNVESSLHLLTNCWYKQPDVALKSEIKHGMKCTLKIIRREPFFFFPSFFFLLGGVGWWKSPLSPPCVWNSSWCLLLIRSLIAWQFKSQVPYIALFKDGLIKNKSCLLPAAQAALC